MAAPAGAVEFSGEFVFQGNSYLDSSWQKVTSLETQYPLTSGRFEVVGASTTDTAEHVLGYALNKAEFYFSQVPIEGSLAVYVSWYLSANFESSFNTFPLDFEKYFRLYQTDGTNILLDASYLNFSSFSPSHVDGRTESQGIIMKGRIPNVDTIIDVSRVQIGLSRRNVTEDYVITKPAGIPGAISIIVPSAVLISGESSTLDSLEGIADSIAAQSQIMSQYYGDIMSLLNDLYSRLGDMQAVQELTNTYFATLIPLVESIESNTALIHTLLQTQFQLLRTLIATESDDIQAAIAQQTEDLKAYFDTVFSGAVGDMPEKSDDLETSVGDLSNAESLYQSTATQRFDDITANFSGFSGGVLAGITLASTLFTRVWDALGEYNIVYFFPLLLGLCLVIIGRLSRGSGGQSSSAKHRGDSSA